MSIDNIGINQIQHWIWEHAYEAKNMRNDGWTSMGHKRKLWELKCLLDDTYSKLPTFVGEEEWQKERLVEILKK